jgi:hypothetical protein
MAERPTAVFCAADMVAFGLIAGLQAGGLSVPGDISVVGFDDIDMSEYYVPSLTTIRQDRHAPWTRGRGGAVAASGTGRAGCRGPETHDRSETSWSAKAPRAALKGFRAPRHRLFEIEADAGHRGGGGAQQPDGLTRAVFGGDEASRGASRAAWSSSQPSPFPRSLGVEVALGLGVGPAEVDPVDADAVCEMGVRGVFRQC